MSGRLNNNLLVALTSGALLSSILAIYYLHHRKKKLTCPFPRSRRTSSSSPTVSASSPTHDPCEYNLPDFSVTTPTENGFCPKSASDRTYIDIDNETRNNEVKQNGSITQEAGFCYSLTESVSIDDSSSCCQEKEQLNEVITSKGDTLDPTRLQEDLINKSLEDIYSNLVTSTESIESEVHSQGNTMQIKDETTHAAELTVMDSSQTDIQCNGSSNVFKKLSCSSPEIMDESSNDSAMELTNKIEKELVITSPAPTTGKKHKKKKSKSGGDVSQQVKVIDTPQPDSRSRKGHASGDSAFAASPDLVEEEVDKKIKEKKPLLDSPHSSQVSTDIGSPVYSDTHSEGSTDSGKPNSSVMNTLSNSPATAHSSPQNDVQRHFPQGCHSSHHHQGSYAIIHQFELPADLVGRVIGRKGVTINDIKARSRANITVYLHPFAPDLRLCAIEGPRRNISIALELLRDLFPLNVYPQVTMHQVYFPEQISTPPTQVILPMGSSVDVILSSMISAGHIFLQSPNEPSFQSLSVLDATMNRSYSEFETPHIAVAVSGMIVAAPIMGGWYRAIVTDVPEPGQVICKFVDYGGYSRLDLSSLRQIRMDFMTLPFQASECYLSDIAPIEGNQWTTETSEFFEQQVLGSLLKASVTGYTQDGCTLIRLYKQDPQNPLKTVFINEQLVKNGFAKWIDGHPSKEEQPETKTVKPSFAAVTKESCPPVTDRASFPELSSSS